MRVFRWSQFVATAIILVLVQKPGDLSPQRRCLQQLAHGPGGVEDLPLQRRRQGVPLHDERRPKTPQNVFFLDGQGRAAGLVMVRNVHGTLVIVGEDLLVIRQRSEASFQFLKFTAFLGAGRSLDQLAVLDTAEI